MENDRPRVLVVEDSPAVLKVIATILETGFQVTTAPDASAALARLAPGAFDVVLTDIRMPGLSGFDLLRLVQDRAPRTAVVMMTAYATVPDAVRAMRFGAFDYVAKPLEAEEISLAVARAAEHARAAPGRPAEAEEDAPAPAAAEEPDVSVAFQRVVDEARVRASRAYLLKLLKEFDGNVTRAAERAGMTRESLQRVLKRYGVRREGDTHTVVDAAPPRPPTRR